MYIHPFWCGVAATLILETVALIGAAMWLGAKTPKKKQRSCGDCPLAAEETYLLDPPMKRCSLTNEYHYFDHKCDVQEGG